MKTIWKFPVPLQDVVEIEMPQDAHILDVQTQQNAPVIWALVWPDAVKVRRTFRVIGTGHPVERAEDLEYIGTFQIHGGALVFHLFEVIA